MSFGHRVFSKPVVWGTRDFAPRIAVVLVVSMGSGISANPALTHQERKNSPKSKFLARISRGHLGVIRADIPAQNFGQGSPNPGEKKNKRFGADIHDPKARTSTAPRDFQKLRSKTFQAEFSFPTQLLVCSCLSVSRVRRFRGFRRFA